MSSFLFRLEEHISHELVERESFRRIDIDVRDFDVFLLGFSEIDGQIFVERSGNDVHGLLLFIGLRLCPIVEVLITRGQKRNDGTAI